ncbi:MAG: chemotaxis response regulator protein-glutamate methylesterase [Saccharospirillaceae bacterium]|nr:chemotaxis response regulator protein-glutamate methylesterase [Pseudomonadales bacterium]NRB78637.1 chemotaxis response regulator protein-glutamate methylesterase [Saccharospirillaceae bacterium]
MTIKVLIVDDSSFLLQQIKQIISSQDDMEVIGQASNGRDAIEVAKKLKPDVITMDYEMPLMDGITAVKVIMAESPTNILMFSSLTYEGAKTTLDALDAGAVDFLSKSFEGVSDHKSRLSNLLCNKIREVACAQKNVISNAVRKNIQSSNIKNEIKKTVTNQIIQSKKRISKIDLIVIGASTGGPVALAKILIELPKDFTIPILIVQHMPASFTGAFAERLDQRCALNVKMAQSEDDINRGGVFIAPGGNQMLVNPSGRLNIREGDEQLNYKPCVDITFASCSKSKFKNVLAIVLTGMGSDGKKGAQMLKQNGHEIWVQSSSSCVVDGMPSSIVNADLADCVLHLDDFAEKMMELM